MISSIAKALFDSLLGFFERFKSEAKRVKIAESIAENARLRKNVELREELRNRDENRKSSDTIDDALDRFK